MISHLFFFKYWKPALVYDTELVYQTYLTDYMYRNKNRFEIPKFLLLFDNQKYGVLRSDTKSSLH